jgi:ketosteroid isomerase-like protein
MTAGDGWRRQDDRRGRDPRADRGAGQSDPHQGRRRQRVELRPGRPFVRRGKSAPEHGSKAARKRLAEWFASFQGPIGYELRDLAITAADDVAFCHGLKRVRATTTAGQRLDMWWRATICYRRIDGAWQVTHEHASVPFDAASGRASLDLEP